MKVKLPVIPRVGEEIFLNLVQRNTWVQKGYVHSVDHAIIGKKQFISIYVHPYHNYYFKWKDMQKSYDDDQKRNRRFNSEM